ncbi:NEDP1 [Scenedesmus sp. PABB004]|nr:NEDP1 [Scenedesmus sp. PABB004]
MAAAGRRAAATRQGPERPALSFHDVLLRHADLDLLRGPHWLNDQVIAFYFEWLAREAHPQLDGAVALVPGAMSYLLANSDPSEAALFCGALRLHEMELVIFAVNDNPDVEAAAGGSHWSCLAYHRPSNTFRHYDSAPPHNRDAARALAGAAAPLVRGRPPHGSGSGGGPVDVALPQFVEVEAVPRQANANDCGVYVLAVARALVELLAAGGAEGRADEAARMRAITPAAVAAMRGEVLALIEGLVAAAAGASGR